jgi:hypothetical protein
MGLLVQCEICGKELIRPLNISEMSLRERLAGDDEELRHFIETAGFKINNIYEDPINLWSILAHERGGHRNYKAMKHVIIYKNAEDGKWMEHYEERQKEALKKLTENGYFEDLFKEKKDD